MFRPRPVFTFCSILGDGVDGTGGLVRRPGRDSIVFPAVRFIPVSDRRWINDRDGQSSKVIGIERQQAGDAHGFGERHVAGIVGAEAAYLVILYKSTAPAVSPGEVGCSSLSPAPGCRQVRKRSMSVRRHAPCARSRSESHFASPSAGSPAPAPAPAPVTGPRGW